MKNRGTECLFTFDKIDFAAVYEIIKLYYNEFLCYLHNVLVFTSNFLQFQAARRVIYENRLLGALVKGVGISFDSQRRQPFER